MNTLNYNRNHIFNLSTNFSTVCIVQGYEDARRIGIDHANSGETANINKSLYALLNVVYAVNTNESRVPYRENKLSRVLQDSFGGSSRVLLLTCLVRSNLIST